MLSGEVGMWMIQSPNHVSGVPKTSLRNLRIGRSTKYLKTKQGDPRVSGSWTMICQFARASASMSLGRRTGTTGHAAHARLTTWSPYPAIPL